MQKWMVGSLSVFACASLAAAVGAQTPPQSASLTLGGNVVLTLRATAGGMTPQQRVDVIDGRISDLLGTPDIKVSDVAVYTPVGKAPVIYALGRRLITVDAATAKSEGEGKTPLELATMWAKTLQQTLPRVNWRPSNEAEPVVPANPPLTITQDLSKVGGNVGLVTLRNKTVFKITGPQTGGLTAQERADMLTKRIQVAASRLSAPAASDVSVVSVSPPVKTSTAEAAKPPTDVSPAAGTKPTAGAKPATAETSKPTDAKTTAAAAESDVPQQILVGTTPIITVDPAQAKAAGYKSAAELASAWAKNVRTALGLPATIAPPDTPAAPAANPPMPPAQTTPVPSGPAS